MIVMTNPFIILIFISLTFIIIVLLFVCRKLNYNGKRYKDFLDNLTDIAYKTDTLGNVTYCNKAAEIALGISAQKLLNKPFLTLFNEESKKKALNIFQEVVKGNKATVELTFNNGLTFQYYCEPEKRFNGKITGTFGIARDVTEKKKVLLQLAETKDLLENTLNIIPDVIGIQDTDHKIIRYNTAGYDFLNKKHSEVVGERCFELIGRTSPCEICATTNCYKSKKPEHIIKFIEELNIWLDIRSYPILDSSGNIKMVVEHLRDITEQKKMELDLKERQLHVQEQAKLLDLIFKYSLDSIVLLDKDYNFIRVSEAYAKACQRNSEDFIGKNHFKLYPSSLKEEFDEVKANKTVYQNSARPFVFPDHPELGTTYWNLGLVPILDKDDNIELFIFTLKDVTENVRTREKIENISKFPEENINPVLRISDSGVLLYANPAARKMILRDEKSIGDIVDEKWLDTIKETFKSTTRKTVEIEFYDRIFLFVLVPFIENKYINLYAFDITEHNRQKSMLQKTEAHLSTLIETLPDLVWLKDIYGVYMTCNRRFEDFFGAKVSNIIGKTDYDFVNKELADFFKEKDKAAMLANKPIINEEVITFASDGHKEKLETIKTPVYTKNGNLLGVLGVGRDITERENMTNNLKKINKELDNAHKHALYMLALASEYKDRETGSHIQRITYLTKQIALKMGVKSEEAEKIGHSSILHDVGKLGISDYILLKPGKLSPSELEIMKQHAQIGAAIIGNNLWFKLAREIALYHHENWNGTGYPEGLKGNEIPLAARIVSVADAFDALVSKRPYKSAWKIEDAAEEIKKESGKKFDPEVVKAFVELLDSGDIQKSFYDDVSKNNN